MSAMSVRLAMNGLVSQVKMNEIRSQCELSPQMAQTGPTENKKRVRRSRPRSSLHHVFRDQGNSEAHFPQQSYNCVNQYFTPEDQLVTRRRYEFDRIVPRNLQDSRVSVNLHDLTVSEEAGQLRNCEDVADRNIAKSNLSPRGMQQPYYMPQTGSGNGLVGPKPCMEPATSDKRQNQSTAIQGKPEGSDVPLCSLSGKFAASLRFKRNNTMVFEAGEPRQRFLSKDERRHSLSHKPNIFDLRTAIVIGHVRSQTNLPKTSRLDLRHSRRTSIKRSTLEKPLPPTPLDVAVQTLQHGRDDATIGNEGCAGDTLEMITSNSSMGRIVSRTEDTTYLEKWAPAVVNETITRKVHEIVEQHVHKAIHQYHVYHRIQPIIDFEVLPARHFVRVGTAYMEVSDCDLPRGLPGAQWLAAEISSSLSSMSDEAVAARQINMRTSERDTTQHRQHWSIPKYREPDITRTYLPAVMSSKTEPRKNL